MRAYLAASLPGADVDRLLELIGSVHNLREIVERPLTLRMVSTACCPSTRTWGPLSPLNPPSRSAALIFRG